MDIGAVVSGLDTHTLPRFLCDRAHTCEFIHDLFPGCGRAKRARMGGGGPAFYLSARPMGIDQSRIPFPSATSMGSHRRRGPFMVLYGFSRPFTRGRSRWFGVWVLGATNSEGPRVNPQGRGAKRSKAQGRRGGRGSRSAAEAAGQRSEAVADQARGPRRGRVGTRSAPRKGFHRSRTRGA